MNKSSSGVRFLLGFVTVLLCVLLLVTTAASILVSNVAQILSSQKNLENLLRQVMFVDIMHPVSVHNASGGNSPIVRQSPAKTLAPADIHLAEQKTATSIVEWIYEALAEDFGDEMQISLETVKEFVERSTLDDFLVEKGAGLINDAYTGESTVTLTPEEIKAKIEENIPLIEAYFNVVVDPQVIADITATIEENQYVARIEEEGILNIILNPEGSTDPMENPESIETQQVIGTVLSVFSGTAVLILVGTCLLLIGLIMVTNIKQIWVGMNATGITLMLAAFPSVVLTVAVWASPSGWSAQYGLANIFEILIRQIITINSVICIGVFVLGLALLVGGIVTKRLVRSKYKKAAAAAEIEAKLVAEVPPTEVTFPTEEENIEETSETV